MRGIARFVLGLMLTVGLTTSAVASVITYTDRASYYAAVFGLPGTTQEGWELFPPDFAIASGSTWNGITYFFSDGSGRIADNYVPISSPNSLGKVATSSSPDFFVGGAAADVIGFSFSQPILAFGVSINTIETLAGTYQFAAFAGASPVGVAASGFDPFPGLATGQFVGLISDTPFDFVGFTSGSAFGYTLDDLTYVSEPVPEPTTTLLLGGGVLSLLARRSRRR